MATILDEFITRFRFDVDDDELRALDKRVANTRKGLDEASRKAREMGQTLALVGGAATAAFALAGRAAITWESDFTGVRKTVNATEEEFAALETRLRKMAKDEIPLTAGELAGVAEAAGQLGIETANIAEFVRVTAMLGTTTNLSAERAAIELARLANITQMPQSEFGRLGATVVDLGNNFATTEAEIVDMARRLAGVGKVFGLTEAEILGIATTLSSVGVESEAGGTAFSRIFAEMDKAIKTGGPELEAFGEAIGKTGGEFAGLFVAEGPQAAIVEFLKGLQRIDDEGENVHLVLEQLGFDNVRIRDALLRTAGAGDLLEEAMVLGTRAWEENVALTREADLRYSTMGARLQFARNQAQDLAITVGGTLAPMFVEMVEQLRPAVEWLSRFAEENPAAIKVAAGLALAVAGLGIALIGIAGVAKLASVAIGAFALATKVAAAAVSLFWLAMGPVGLIIALVAALAVAGFFIYKYRDAIVGFFKDVYLWAKEKVLNGLRAVWSWLKTNWPLLLGILLGPFGLAIGAFIRWRTQITDFFKDLIDSAFGAGKGLIDAFLEGVLGAAQGLWDGVKGVFDKVRDFLPFSDAKVGPLSDLTKSGQALIATLQAGINAAPGLSLPDLGSLAAPLQAGPLPAPAGAASGGTTLQLTIEQLIIQVPSGDPEVIAQHLPDALRRQARGLVEEFDSKIRA